jgi:hypothetical protein
MIPPNDVDFSDVQISSTGDYSAPQLRAATHRSRRLVGDVVQHYLRSAGGKLGLTFAVDIESANELCVAYRKAGIPSEIITGNTSIPARANIMRSFRERRILQLVSVDVLGEGTDVPAVEVVSLARRTASWQLMCQQIGRALRVSVAGHDHKWGEYSDAERRTLIAASAKPKAIILDHVGNVLHHYEQRGFPDSKQVYSLMRPDRGSRGAPADAIPLRTCLSCFQPYERFMKYCPYCGEWPPPPAGRSTPEAVGGDLVELDPDVLASLRREIEKVDGAPVIPRGVDRVIAKSIKNRHLERQLEQTKLRHAIAVWSGYWKANGLDDREIHRRHFDKFGVDVMTAQAYNVTEASALRTRIEADLTKLNVVEG